MYNGVSADIDSNVAAVAYDIARLHCVCAYAVSYACQCAGGMGQANAECCIDTHYKSGTVSAVGQACPAVYIRIAYKLAGIICNCLSASAAWRSITSALSGSCFGRT